MTTHGGDDEFEGVLALWQERLERGEEIDAEVEVCEHPHLEARLRQALAAMGGLGRAFPAPVTDDADAPPSREGTLLGPYRLERHLGAGGMGEVWLASVEGKVPGLADGARVAVKVIHPQLVARPGFFKRFLREAEIGRRLRHPNVVRTLDADEVALDGASVRFLVLEYVEGETLRDVLDDLGTLPEELCRHVGREVAKALAAIHGAGAIHRDLKPENVLVTKDHVVKVTDLGVARLSDEGMRLSQSGVFVGSLQYGAPEQFRRTGEIDGRADLHALGVLLYEISSGTHPFAGDDLHAVMRRILDESPRRVGEVQPQIAPFFDELLAQLLQKDPDDRFASADEVLRILDEGEDSAWWRERAKAIRATTKRPLRRIRIPRETALYGRDAELARLRAHYERAKSDEGQVLLVEGEAGIGKSRLVDEFVGGLVQAGEDVNYLFGSYPPGGAATASGAFSTAYREHFGDDESAVRVALPQTPLLVAAFAALLRGDAAPVGSEPLTKDSLQTVFVHATRSLAGGRPTIVLIDDLHFAPEEGRALFASLALAVPGHRILLVGTMRPGIDEKWLSNLDRIGASRLPLPRLGVKDLVFLLKDALRSEHLAEELAVKIGVKSDGNPFFVFEILRGLREGQFLTKRPDGTWISTRVIRDIEVPSSVTDLVQARVSDLGPDDRNALEVASCLGFEWDPTLVAAVLGLPRVALLQRLGRIEKTHRVVRSSGRRFVFDHHQIQETLYAGLSELLREEYHAAIADAIADIHGTADKDPKDLDGALCVGLAEHFLKGGQGPRALRYLDAALTHLEAGYLNEPAIRLADQALGVSGLMLGQERSGLLLRKAARLDTVGSRDAQHAALEEAMTLADACGDAASRARVRVSVGALLIALQRYDEAIVRLADAFELSATACDRRTGGRAAGNLGIALLHLGRHDEAQTAFDHQLAFARDCRDHGAEAGATVNLGNVFYVRGLYEEARRRYESGLLIARETRHAAFEANALGNLGLVLLESSRPVEALTHLEQSLRVKRQIGDRLGESNSTCHVGLALRTLGRLGEALALLERGVAVAKEIRNRHGEALALFGLGLVLGDLGNAASARECLASSRALSGIIGDRFIGAQALTALGVAADRAGDRQGALSFVEEALALQIEIAFRGGIDALYARARLRAQLGETNAARNDFTSAAVIAEKLDLAPFAVLCAVGLASLPGGEPAPALARLAKHAAHLDVFVRMDACFLLWRITDDALLLVDAKRQLDFAVEHSPPEFRKSMLTNVRLHREIVEAASQHGL